jgi:integrase
LTSATEIKTVAGDLDRLPQDAKGLITKFMAYMEGEGYTDKSQYPVILRHLAKDGADLMNPENVKQVIAQQKKKSGEPWSNSMKMLTTYAYDAFCTMQAIQWNMPKYRQDENTLNNHDEKDLDMLINAASRRMATYLQCLKETFADPSEILRAEWIDLKENVLSINHPVKSHLPGKYELTPRLTAMINALPRKDKRIFPTSYRCSEDCLIRLRKRAVAKTQNPTLLTITFKSFRHWGGSMLAHRTNGNVLLIKRLLRHKSITNTMKYIHTIEFKEEDYEETVASTVEEIRMLGKAGWMKYDEITVNGTQMHFYRKPKRFGGLRNTG